MELVFYDSYLAVSPSTENPSTEESGSNSSTEPFWISCLCTVMNEMNGNCFQLPFFTLQGFLLYEAIFTILGEPLPESLLSWSRGGLVNALYTL